MGVKMNLSIITKNHAADSKIGSPYKIEFRADETHESHPTAWELNIFSLMASENKKKSRIFLVVLSLSS